MHSYSADAVFAWKDFSHFNLAASVCVKVGGSVKSNISSCGWRECVQHPASSSHIVFWPFNFGTCQYLQLHCFCSSFDPSNLQKMTQENGKPNFRWKPCCSFYWSSRCCSTHRPWFLVYTPTCSTLKWVFTLVLDIRWLPWIKKKKSDSWGCDSDSFKIRDAPIQLCQPQCQYQYLSLASTRYRSNTTVELTECVPVYTLKASGLTLTLLLLLFVCCPPHDAARLTNVELKWIDQRNGSAPLSNNLI